MYSHAVLLEKPVVFSHLELSLQFKIEIFFAFNKNTSVLIFGVFFGSAKRFVFKKVLILEAFDGTIINSDDKDLTNHG